MRSDDWDKIAEALMSEWKKSPPAAPARFSHMTDDVCVLYDSMKKSAATKKNLTFTSESEAMDERPLLNKYKVASTVKNKITKFRRWLMDTGSPFSCHVAWTMACSEPVKPGDWLPVWS